jgi:putative ABC transport system substrate-binding protein
MAIGIGRREFIAALGAAMAWPLAARSQQPAMPVIGFLSVRSPNDLSDAGLIAPFQKGLNETGYVEDQNVTIEYSWSGDQYGRLPELAAEFARRRVAVIAAIGSAASARAAKAASATIPVVFANGSDPVKMGLVASLNAPGGNVTGISFLVNTLQAKKLELLHELVPAVPMVAVLVNPNNADTEFQLKDLEEAAHSLGTQLIVMPARTASEIDTAFERFDKRQVGALLVGSDAFFNSQRKHIIALASRYRLPAIFSQRSYAADGGLMSYGTSFADAYHQAGIYVGRILKGQKPADLPVQQSVKVELILNLRTAKALQLQVPDKLLARADEVIE